jgi:lipopolysaccharide transport system permease protein
MNVTVYTPDTGMRHPGRLLKDMARNIFTRQSRDLAFRMLLRNLSAQYRQTLLGYFWLFFPPVVTSAIFIFLNGQGVVKVMDAGVPYPLFVLTGNLLWQGMLMTMQAPVRTLQRERMLISKLNFSREALLVSSFGEGLVAAVIPMVLMPILFLVFKVPLNITMLLAPVGVFLFLLFGFTIGVLLTPLGILYKDIGLALPLLGRFWLFLTPVVYPLPETGLARTIFLVNPATPFVEVVRKWMLGQSAESTVFFSIYSLATIALLVVGFILYRLAMPIVAERMSS